MKRLIMTVALVGAFAVVPGASAQSASEGYGAVKDVVTHGGNSGSGGNGTAPTALASQTQPASSSGLPFTGLDLALIAGGGILLLGMGFTLRRVARERGQDTI